jgi:hypothetical protein
LSRKSGSIKKSYLIRPLAFSKEGRGQEAFMQKGALVVGALTHHQLQATCIKDSGGGRETNSSLSVAFFTDGNWHKSKHKSPLPSA